jgi:hypothetical protein
VVDLVAIASGLAEFGLLARIEAGELVTESEADANDLRQAAIGVTQLVLLAVAAFLFIRWFHRAYKNLPALGAGELRFRPGWAIWGWFVPVLGLWRPKQIANDIWRASDPDLPPDQASAWRGASVPAVFLFWWGLFVVSNWASWVAFRLSLSAEEVTELRGATTAYLLADSSDLLAAVFAILVVRRTTSRHEERARRLAPAP